MSFNEKQVSTEAVEKPASIKSQCEDDCRITSNDDAHSLSKDIECQAKPSLRRIESHISTHDAIDERPEHHVESEEIYDRFSRGRKVFILVIMSICGLVAPMSSTSILAASVEVVQTYHTTGTIFNVSNALYMLFMGISPLFYGPIGQTYGRKWTLTVANVCFTGFSIGSALAPNLASYFVFRILTAFQGTALLVIAGTVIGDIYKPTERGTAYGWFMSGTLIGPAFGPFLGGVIVNFSSWRNIFWMQTAMAALCTISVIVFLPETIHKRRSDELIGLSRKQKIKTLWSWINPARIVILFKYPNLLIVGLASSSLVWNMYSLLTPIRYVLNPRFNLTSPIESGLFYLAPGAGYLLGTFMGGRFADYTTKRWIRKRNGVRVAEDRLRSSLPFMGIIIPACMLIYGWSIEKKVGGIALPVICMFLQGLAQLFCFPSLNTYCLDVMQKRSSEVVAGNYFIRYLFGAAGSAAVLPIVDAIGVGWFSTISGLFVAVAAGGVWAVTIWGQGWREKIDSVVNGEDV